MIDQLKAELQEIAVDLPPADLNGCYEYVKERASKLTLISLQSNRQQLQSSAELARSAMEYLNAALLQLLEVQRLVNEYAEQL
ncbi:hypothetical protein [Prauserella muralis]|uniref:Uncharacterized protein n=1 Tax=Prauserella muralis TaxID=588067 RepID=A0A2V4ALD4_9PSEU|nr:hypothetical protein [Prauserella muralis]PXY21111.1 hypothetical protein BAY60_26965 [Prauserella muralis]TWE30197.1 hypothetical protein FHX69_2894 [Prauserella muralis]